MSLEQMWEKYKDFKEFNYSTLSNEAKRAAVRVEFAPKSIITMAGEYPEFVHFIAEGTAQGVRIYQNGNSYHYFSLTKDCGPIGLLELLSQEKKYVATIIAATPVITYRISAPLIYEMIMTDIKLLRSCLHSVSHDLYQRSSNDGLLYYQSGIDRVQFFLASYYCTNAKARETIPLQVDYQTIASNTGISLRTVGRSIQLLKEQGLVTVDRKKIWISFAQYENLRSANHTNLSFKQR